MPEQLQKNFVLGNPCKKGFKANQRHLNAEDVVAPILQAYPDGTQGNLDL